MSKTVSLAKYFFYLRYFYFTFCRVATRRLLCSWLCQKFCPKNQENDKKQQESDTLTCVESAGTQVAYENVWVHRCYWSETKAMSCGARPHRGEVWCLLTSSPSVHISTGSTQRIKSYFCIRTNTQVALVQRHLVWYRVFLSKKKLSFQLRWPTFFTLHSLNNVEKMWNILMNLSINLFIFYLYSLDLFTTYIYLLTRNICYNINIVWYIFRSAVWSLTIWEYKFVLVHILPSFYGRLKRQSFLSQ